jgi:hypothetical protein
MISNLVLKRTDREFETSIDSLIKLSQTGCSQTLLICTPNATANGCIGLVLSFVKILAFLICQTVVNNWSKMIWAELVSGPS